MKSIELGSGILLNALADKQAGILLADQSTIWCARIEPTARILSNNASGREDVTAGRRIDADHGPRR
jgi:hypothetical protein